MRIVNFRGLLLLGASCAITVGAIAQKPTLIPSRPKLDASADTNDARSYYAYGMQTVYDKPAEAIRGFYWASQIDPTSAEMLYALQSATLLSMTAVEMGEYYDYSKHQRSPEYLAIDSLLFRAYTINPFLYPSFERALSRHRLEAEAVASNPNIDRAKLNDWIITHTNVVRFHASAEYATGQLGDALADYAKELSYKGWSKRELAMVAGNIHATRACIFYQLGNIDSARTELVAAIAAMKDRDAKAPVILYRSKAVYEQSLGMIYERQGLPDSARGAYGEALSEDLAYYPAHTRMAQMQLAKGDTAGAITELDLAVQLQPTNAAIRYAYAIALVKAQRDADAVKQLKLAIDGDRYYAAPHLLLARIADAEDFADDATAEYQRYVALAAHADPGLAFARSRLTKLGATAATAPITSSTASAAQAKPE